MEGIHQSHLISNFVYLSYICVLMIYTPIYGWTSQVLTSGNYSKSFIVLSKEVVIRIHAMVLTHLNRQKLSLVYRTTKKSLNKLFIFSILRLRSLEIVSIFLIGIINWTLTLWRKTSQIKVACFPGGCSFIVFQYLKKSKTYYRACRG